MKKLIAALMLFASTVLGANLDVRHFYTTNDISGSRPVVTPLRWSQGESVKWDLYLVRGSSNLDLSATGLSVRMEAFLATNQTTAYILESGTIISNGHVYFDLEPSDASAPATNYTLYVKLYQDVSGTNRYVGQAWKSDLQILWGPSATNTVYTGPYNNGTETDPIFKAFTNNPAFVIRPTVNGTNVLLQGEAAVQTNQMYVAQAGTAAVALAYSETDTLQTVLNRGATATNLNVEIGNFKLWHSPAGRVLLTGTNASLGIGMTSTTNENYEDAHIFAYPSIIELNAGTNLSSSVQVFAGAAADPVTYTADDVDFGGKTISSADISAIETDPIFKAFTNNPVFVVRPTVNGSNVLLSGEAATFTNLFAGQDTTGSVTSAAGDAGKYLRADGTWQTVTVTGVVTNGQTNVTFGVVTASCLNASSSLGLCIESVNGTTSAVFGVGSSAAAIFMDGLTVSGVLSATGGITAGAGNINLAGNSITNGSHVGNGSGLTNLTGANITGSIGVTNYTGVTNWYASGAFTNELLVGAAQPFIDADGRDRFQVVVSNREAFCVNPQGTTEIYSNLNMNGTAITNVGTVIATNFRIGATSLTTNLATITNVATHGTMLCAFTNSSGTSLSWYAISPAVFTPYIIPYAAAVTINLTNGNYQFLHATGATTTVTLPDVATNYGAGFVLEIDKGANSFAFATNNCVTQGVGSITSLVPTNSGVSSFVFRRAYGGTNVVNLWRAF